MLVAVATFTAASALLIVLPGPDNVLVIRNALRYGRFVALAAYLVWLGVASLRSRGRVAFDVTSRSDRSAATGRVGYLMGVVSNLANPKTGVFFIAFFPTFIPHGSPIGTTSLLFSALFVVEAAAWFAVLIWLVSRLASWLSQHRVQRRLERISGLCLIGFAVRLAADRR